MDSNVLATAGISSSAMAIFFLVYKVLQKVVGHRLISDCCGRRLEVGIDIRDMPKTPSVHSLENGEERRPSVCQETLSHPPHQRSFPLTIESHSKETRVEDTDSEPHSQHKNLTIDIPNVLPPLLVI